MIISHQRKFIFIKTRKTAGTSLEIGLSKYCGPNDIITPITAEDESIRSQLGFRGPQNTAIPQAKGHVPGLVKTLIRGPRRFYNHMPASEIIQALGNEIWSDYFTFTIEREPYDKAISGYYWRTQQPRPTIEDHLSKVPAGLLSNWQQYTINDTVVVDFVIRFDHLHHDLAIISERLGLGDIEMPRAKGQYRKDRSHYSQVLTPCARKRIEVVCAKEIRHFGFEWKELHSQ